MTYDVSGRRLLVLVVIMLCIKAAGCADQQDGRLPPQLEAAEKAYGEGDYARAIGLLTDAIDGEKAGVNHAFYLRSKCYLASGDLTSALADVNTHIDRFGATVRARILRASVQNALGHHQVALEELDVVLQQDPNHDEARLLRGRIRLFELGLAEDSLDDWRNILHRRHGHSDAYYYRGIALMQLGKPCEARLDFLQAYIRDRNNPGKAIAYVESNLMCRPIDWLRLEEIHEAAKHGCELTGWTSTRHLIAYAKTIALGGDVKKAIAMLEGVLPAADAEEQLNIRTTIGQINDGLWDRQELP